MTPPISIALDTEWSDARHGVYGLATTMMNAASTSDRPDLSSEEVRQNTRINSPVLVAEVFSQARVLVAEEAARSTRLDAKANALLTAIGLIGALVAILLRSDLKSGAALILCACGALSALASVGCAVKALHVTAHLRIPDAALFSAEILDRADERPNLGEGVAEYQRYLLPALWTSHQRTCTVNDAKARFVSLGQVLFFVAIAIPTLGIAVLAAKAVLALAS